MGLRTDRSPTYQPPIISPKKPVAKPDAPPEVKPEAPKAPPPGTKPEPKLPDLASPSQEQEVLGAIDSGSPGKESIDYSPIEGLLDHQISTQDAQVLGEFVKGLTLPLNDSQKAVLSKLAENIQSIQSSSGGGRGPLSEVLKSLVTEFGSDPQLKGILEPIAQAYPPSPVPSTEEAKVVSSPDSKPNAALELLRREDEELFNKIFSKVAGDDPRAAQLALHLAQIYEPPEGLDATQTAGHYIRHVGTAIALANDLGIDDLGILGTVQSKVKPLYDKIDGPKAAKVKKIFDKLLFDPNATKSYSRLKNLGYLMNGKADGPLPYEDSPLGLRDVRAAFELYLDFGTEVKDVFEAFVPDRIQKAAGDLIDGIKTKLPTGITKHADKVLALLDDIAYAKPFIKFISGDGVDKFAAVVDLAETLGKKAFGDSGKVADFLNFIKIDSLTGDHLKNILLKETSPEAKFKSLQALAQTFGSRAIDIGIKSGALEMTDDMLRKIGVSEADIAAKKGADSAIAILKKYGLDNPAMVSRMKLSGATGTTQYLDTLTDQISKIQQLGVDNADEAVELFDQLKRFGVNNVDEAIGAMTKLGVESGPESLRLLAKLKTFGIDNVEEATQAMTKLGTSTVTESAELLTKLKPFGVKNLDSAVEAMGKLGVNTAVEAFTTMSNLGVKNADEAVSLLTKLSTFGIENVDEALSAIGKLKVDSADDALKFLETFGANNVDDALKSMEKLGASSADEALEVLSKLGVNNADEAGQLLSKLSTFGINNVDEAADLIKVLDVKGVDKTIDMLNAMGKNTHLPISDMVSRMKDLAMNGDEVLGAMKKLGADNLLQLSNYMKFVGTTDVSKAAQVMTELGVDKAFQAKKALKEMFGISNKSSLIQIQQLLGTRNLSQTKTVFKQLGLTGQQRNLQAATNLLDSLAAKGIQGKSASDTISKALQVATDMNVSSPAKALQALTELGVENIDEYTQLAGKLGAAGADDLIAKTAQLGLTGQPAKASLELLSKTGVESMDEALQLFESVGAKTLQEASEKMSTAGFKSASEAIDIMGKLGTTNVDEAVKLIESVGAKTIQEATENMAKAGFASASEAIEIMGKLGTTNVDEALKVLDSVSARTFPEALEKMSTAGFKNASEAIDIMGKLGTTNVDEAITLSKSLGAKTLQGAAENMAKTGFTSASEAIDIMGKLGTTNVDEALQFKKFIGADSLKAAASAFEPFTALGENVTLKQVKGFMSQLSISKPAEALDAFAQITKASDKVAIESLEEATDLLLKMKTKKLSKALDGIKTLAKIEGVTDAKKAIDLLGALGAKSPDEAVKLVEELTKRGLSGNADEIVQFLKKNHLSSAKQALKKIDAAAAAKAARPLTEAGAGIVDEGLSTVDDGAKGAAGIADDSLKGAADLVDEGAKGATEAAGEGFKALQAFEEVSAKNVEAIAEMASKAGFSDEAVKTVSELFQNLDPKTLDATLDILEKMGPENVDKILPFLKEMGPGLLENIAKYMPEVFAELPKLLPLAEKVGLSVAEFAPKVVSGLGKALPAAGALISAYDTYKMGSIAMTGSYVSITGEASGEYNDYARALAFYGMNVNALDTALGVAEAFGVGNVAVAANIALAVGSVGLEIAMDVVNKDPSIVENNPVFKAMLGPGLAYVALYDSIGTAITTAIGDGDWEPVKNKMLEATEVLKDNPEAMNQLLNEVYGQMEGGWAYDAKDTAASAFLQELDPSKKEHLAVLKGLDHEIRSAMLERLDGGPTTPKEYEMMSNLITTAPVASKTAFVSYLSEQNWTNGQQEVLIKDAITSMNAEELNLFLSSEDKHLEITTTHAKANQVTVYEETVGITLQNVLNSVDDQATFNAIAEKFLLTPGVNPAKVNAFIEQANSPMLTRVLQQLKPSELAKMSSQTTEKLFDELSSHGGVNVVANKLDDLTPGQLNTYLDAHGTNIPKLVKYMSTDTYSDILINLADKGNAASKSNIQDIVQNTTYTPFIQKAVSEMTPAQLRKLTPETQQIMFDKLMAEEDLVNALKVMGATQNKETMVGSLISNYDEFGSSDQDKIIASVKADGTTQQKKTLYNKFVESEDIADAINVLSSLPSEQRSGALVSLVNSFEQLGTADRKRVIDAGVKYGTQAQKNELFKKWVGSSTDLEPAFKLLDASADKSAMIGVLAGEVGKFSYADTVSIATKVLKTTDNPEQIQILFEGIQGQSRYFGNGPQLIKDIIKENGGVKGLEGKLNKESFVALMGKLNESTWDKSMDSLGLTDDYKASVTQMTNLLNLAEDSFKTEMYTTVLSTWSNERAEAMVLDTLSNLYDSDFTAVMDGLDINLLVDSIDTIEKRRELVDLINIKYEKNTGTLLNSVIAKSDEWLMPSATTIIYESLNDLDGEDFKAVFDTLDYQKFGEDQQAHLMTLILEKYPGSKAEKGAAMDKILDTQSGASTNDYVEKMVLELTGAGLTEQAVARYLKSTLPPGVISDLQHRASDVSLDFTDSTTLNVLKLATE